MHLHPSFGAANSYNCSSVFNDQKRIVPSAETVPNSSLRSDGSKAHAWMVFV